MTKEESKHHLELYEKLQSENERLKAEREWISVEDRLPELTQGVLICISNGMITIGYRSQGAIITNHPHSYHWQLFGDTNKSLVIDENDSVTHWKELPQPPKQ